MELKVEIISPLEFHGDALVVGLYEGGEELPPFTASLDKVLDGAISRLLSHGEIKGKAGESLLIHTLGKLPVERILVVGLGKAQDLGLDRVRAAIAESARHLRKVGTKRVGVVLFGVAEGQLPPEASARALAEGTILGLYVFEKYKKEKTEKEVQELVLLAGGDEEFTAAEQGAGRGKVLAEATNFARDLVNEPANSLTPGELAKRAEEMAREYGLEFQALGREEMLQLGMGAFLGVAQGSAQPPCLIVLSYKGGGEGKPALGLVGKGITFDSGGISIKPSQGMEQLKGDKAGGAAAIAAVRAIAELKLPINATAIVPATENLPSGTAQRPGDVVRAMNGKTIEVISTDAEGRLILADAFCYARKLGLSPLIDVATLTRACAISLGSVRTGAFGNDKVLIDQVIKAGEKVGEKIWPMPMDEEYDEQLKSDVADLKNLGVAEGGAIVAAKFLGHFVESTPWVHLDIAGTSQSDKERNYQPKGATGVTVRTLIQLAIDLSSVMHDP